MTNRIPHIPAITSKTTIVETTQHFSFRIFFMRTIAPRNSCSVRCVRSVVVSIYRSSQTRHGYIDLDAVNHFVLFIHQESEIEEHLLDFLHTLLNAFDFLVIITPHSSHSILHLALHTRLNELVLHCRFRVLSVTVVHSEIPHARRESPIHEDSLLQRRRDASSSSRGAFHSAFGVAGIP